MPSLRERFPRTFAIFQEAREPQPRKPKETGLDPVAQKILELMESPEENREVAAREIATLVNNEISKAPELFDTTFNVITLGSPGITTYIDFNPKSQIHLESIYKQLRFLKPIDPFDLTSQTPLLIETHEIPEDEAWIRYGRLTYDKAHAVVLASKKSG